MKRNLQVEGSGVDQSRAREILGVSQPGCDSHILVGLLCMSHFSESSKS